MILHLSISRCHQVRQLVNMALPLCLALPALLLASCQHKGAQDAGHHQNGQENHYPEAIRTVIAEDAVLGAVRDHACEDTTLSATIRQYVAGIDALDFSACPAEFTAAFRKHRDAWENTLPFFSQYDSLRGEMHVLFETIAQSGESQKANYERALKAIMDTWGEVEAAAHSYNALPEGE